MNSPENKWGKKETLLGGVLLILAVVAVYGGSLNAPWYFDDFLNITDNPAIRELGNPFSQLFASRGLVYWTFSLNYRLGGLDLQGYHLMNIGIHLVTVFLVFAILIRLLEGRPGLALGGALIFAVHPLQTQSVTYLVQRMTCMSGLFFFLSLLLFLLARSARSRSVPFLSARHLPYYLGALMAGGLAVLSKQNAATLPFVLALLLWLHPEAKGENEGWRSRSLYLAPFFLMPLYMALDQIALPVISSGSKLADLGTVQTLTPMQRPSSLNYLVTQFSVLWIYLRLVVLPFGQALEYSYPLVDQIWTIRNLLALAGLLGLGAIAWRLRIRRPLITLGIFWYFCTLSVESSVIVLDTIIEHRLYVPLFGLILIALDLLSRLQRTWLVRGIFCLLILFFGLLAWQRNLLWVNPITFYEDNLRVAPHSERVMVDLATHYINAGRNSEAEVLLERAIEINPDYELAYGGLSKIYVDRGAYDLARELLLSAIKRFPKSIPFLDSLGTILDFVGDPVQAERVLKQAIALAPSYSNAYLNLGAVYARQGKWGDAIDLYRQSLERFPETSMLCYNYGVALYSIGRLAEAREQFRRAFQLNPLDADAAYNLGFVSLELGDRETAVSLLPKLRNLDAGKLHELERELATRPQGREAR